nr:MAG TPA: hypothetical protein [Caudoviricetes sp.]
MNFKYYKQTPSSSNGEHLHLTNGENLNENESTIIISN